MPYIFPTNSYQTKALTDNLEICYCSEQGCHTVSHLVLKMPDRSERYITFTHGQTMAKDGPRYTWAALTPVGFGADPEPITNCACSRRESESTPCGFAPVFRGFVRNGRGRAAGRDFGGASVHCAQPVPASQELTDGDVTCNSTLLEWHEAFPVHGGGCLGDLFLRDTTGLDWEEIQGWAPTSRVSIPNTPEGQALRAEFEELAKKDPLYSELLSLGGMIVR